VVQGIELVSGLSPKFKQLSLEVLENSQNFRVIPEIFVSGLNFVVGTRVQNEEKIPYIRNAYNIKHKQLQQNVRGPEVFESKITVFGENNSVLF